MSDWTGECRRSVIKSVVDAHAISRHRVRSNPIDIRTMLETIPQTCSHSGSLGSPEVPKLMMLSPVCGTRKNRVRSRACSASAPLTCPAISGSMAVARERWAAARPSSVRSSYSWVLICRHPSLGVAVFSGAENAPRARTRSARHPATVETVWRSGCRAWHYSNPPHRRSPPGRYSAD